MPDDIIIGKVTNKDMFFNVDDVGEPDPKPKPKDTDPEPKDVDPKDVDPKDVDPKDVDPKDVDPKDADPKDTNPEPKEGDIFFDLDLDKGDPKDTDPEPKDTDPEPKDTDPKPKEGDDDDTDYSDVVRYMISSGEWQDFEMTGEDDEVIKIDDLSGLSKDEFEEIAKQQTKARRDADREATLSNLTDSEKEFLEFKDAGGDMNLYVQTHQFRESAKQIPIETPEQQRMVIASHQKNILNYPEDKVKKNLSRITEEELLEEAEYAKGEIDKFAEKQHEGVVEERAKIKREYEDAEKSYKNRLKTHFKGTGLETKEANNLVRAFTAKDEKGYTVVDMAFLKFKSDPEKAQLLYQFLTDTENFVKTVSQKKVNDKNLQQFQGLRFKKKGAKSKQTDSHRRENPRDKSEIFINIPDKE